MEKYMAVVLGVFFICMFGGLALDGYLKHECRIEAVKVGKSAEEISKICK